MKKLTYILPLVLTSFMFSCNSEKSEETHTNEENTTVEEKGGAPAESVASNTYSLDPSSVAVKWTAFKLAEKVGVNGEFTSFALTGYHDNAASVKELMTDAEISLDVASTATGDESRDGKIITSFFGTMTGTEKITAKIISLEGEDKGTAIVNISMNGTSIDQELHWLFREDLSAFILKGIINVPDWDAQNALDELNKVCEEKHKGTGDKAVTWPDVEVNANVKVVITSPEAI